MTISFVTRALHQEYFLWTEIKLISVYFKLKYTGLTTHASQNPTLASPCYSSSVVFPEIILLQLFLKDYFYLFPNMLSSISTVRPSPPILWVAWVSIKWSAITSLKKVLNLLIVAKLIFVEDDSSSLSESDVKLPSVWTLQKKRLRKWFLA